MLEGKWCGKKSKIGRDNEIMNMSPRLISFPSLNSGHSPTLRCKISSGELMKALESILGQINWSEVVLDVTGKEGPVTFRSAFQKIL